MQPRIVLADLLTPGETPSKTTFRMRVEAEVVRRGGAVTYLDSEMSIDREFAGRLGVVLPAPRVETGG